MKLDQIQLNIQDAKVELNIGKPQQYIKQKTATQSIEQPAAILHITQRDAKLLVDSSQAYRELGLLTTKESIEQAAQKGKSSVMKAIARTAQEGNQMMDISKANGRSVLASIARSYDGIKKHKLGIDWKPSVGSVKIKYQAGHLDVQIQANKPKIDVQLGDVIHNYIPGKVTGSLLQRESVETTVIKGE